MFVSNQPKEICHDENQEDPAQERRMQMRQLQVPALLLLQELRASLRV
jgi:hypothetical protein